MVTPYTPDRGDLVWMNFDPILGREQGGRRPAFILSGKIYNRAGMALICPITSKVKGYPFEILIEPEIYKGEISGVILSDHVRTVDWTLREIQFIAKAPPTVVQGVQKNLQRLTFE